MYPNQKSSSQYGPKKTLQPYSPGGTQFYHHYPSNFLRPYGVASAAPTHYTLLKRLNPVSCEWLKRPKIAMSEFAATMCDNMSALTTLDSKWVDHKRLKKLNRNMQPFLEPLANLNTRNPEANPNPTHVDAMLAELYKEDGATHEAMKEIFQVGGSMFLMATQYLAVRELLRSPKEYAAKMVGKEPGVKKFQHHQNVPSLLAMLKANCAPESEQEMDETETSGHLMAQLKSAQTTKKKKKKVNQHRLPPPNPPPNPRPNLRQNLQKTPPPVSSHKHPHRKPPNARDNLHQRDRNQRQR